MVASMRVVPPGAAGCVGGGSRSRGVDSNLPARRAHPGPEQYVDSLTQHKWDSAARTYDLANGYGPERRWAPYKRRLFSLMTGKVLFVAVGTGQDIQFFPPRQQIVAVDISPKMLKRAAPRAAAYSGELELRHADVHHLPRPR